MSEQKFYVVWKGIKPGIYTNWKECEKQVKGFEGAVYKSFKQKEKAENAFKDNPWKSLGRKKSLKQTSSQEKPILDSICVDAACSGNPGLLEYKGVYTSSKELLFHKGPFQEGTNKIGEFLALVHAIAFLKEKKIDIPVYTDSMTALSWLKNKKIKTTLQQTYRNKELFDLVDRAVKWLQENKYKTVVMKWDTKNWGEIPADFGRK